ncbi:ankyrin repeat domain-containing protein 50-like [Cucurbita maxima]|uniref:Ankyrin repeat domain-containing protein 50-like n=1 Tax=Cucurbita maxima TaxID=3661 RepID=A0A6J1KSC8_CUCMA|nr:ankyrin repeat domain-containing protein 50-like [Cucurbita maxima]
MDRLVKPDVKEVEFCFTKGEKCSATFTLANLMHTMSVAVCLTSSNPSVFSFSQDFSVIPPLSSSSYTISCKSSDQPPLSNPSDKISVRSAMVPIGNSHTDDLRLLFSKHGRHIFKDALLLISFVGPDVVEFLISHHNRITELSFLFNKAISSCTKSQLTALMEPAILSGKLGLVSALIDAGVDVNVKDSLKRSMMSLAVMTGKIDIVKRLIDSHCQIDFSVDLVLHIAASMNRVDFMELLVKKFPDILVNSVDSNGRTPIHTAAARGHVEAIRFLLSIGGNPEAVDRNKWTPLHSAAAEGHFEAVEYFLNCSNVKYAVNSDGKTAFALASENGHTDLFDSLRLGDALHRAARAGDVRGLRSCVAAGAKINGKDQNGWTALHRAAFKGRVECVKALLEHGADTDAVDDAGYTPLQCAVESGQEEVARVLLASGAEPNPLKCLRRDLAVSGRQISSLCCGN